MKVEEIMTRAPKTCTPETNLAEAAHLMWEGDCGILPVITDGGRIIGLVTDRDICMASFMNFEHVREIPVSRVITEEVYACRPEADIHDALKLMQQHRIRRLPVVNAEGRLEGLLSMNDVTLEAKQGRAGITFADVVSTMKAICGHRDLPQVEAQPLKQKTATV
jgi:CBS domain-containing protein